MLQKLWGPAIRFDVSKLNLKSAGYGAPVEWHQDWAFYPQTNDDVLAERDANKEIRNAMGRALTQGRR